MHTILVMIATLLFFPAFSQEPSRHFRYDFKTAAYIQFTMLPTETKVIETHVIWHTVRDNRFLLLYLEEVSTESDFEGGVQKENWDDTLLFDLKTYKLYMQKERKCFQFEKRFYSFNREGKFVSRDTLIDCSMRVPEGATPTPTLAVGKMGVGVFKTKNFTFKFRDEVESKMNLNTYFEKYRNFAFSTGKPPFVF